MSGWRKTIQVFCVTVVMKVWSPSSSSSGNVLEMHVLVLGSHWLQETTHKQANYRAAP